MSPLLQGGISVYLITAITGHLWTDMHGQEDRRATRHGTPNQGVAQEMLNWLGTLRAHSHPLRCQPLNASGNTSQTLALARSGGGATPGENPCMLANVWVGAIWAHIFSLWNIKLHTDTWLFLHLNDASSFGWDSNVLLRGSGFYDCQKPS